MNYGSIQRSSVSVHCSVVGKYKFLTGLEGFCFKRKTLDTCPKAWFPGASWGDPSGGGREDPIQPAGQSHGLDRET